MSYVRMGGFDFPQKLFQKNITIFKEGFAHTSIACEQAFTEMFIYEDKIRALVDHEHAKRYKSLSKPNRDIINKYLYFFVLYLAKNANVLPETPILEDYETNAKIYEERFGYLDDYLYKCIVFDQKKFDQRATFRKVAELFKYSTIHKFMYDRAHSMKKDYLDAFDYALEQDHIGMHEIKEINRIVTQSSDDHEEGFKRVNNMISGATFATYAKETIPTQIQELIYRYDHGFGEIILDPDSDMLTREEKKKEILKICRKEAILHIELERIHPFADGNGRTGRIILNRNLIKQGLAPVLVTEVTMDKYKKFIETRNYDEFAEWIMENSQQTLTPWVTELRMHYRMDPTSIDTIDRSKKARK